MNMSIGYRIKQCLKMAGKTQKELASGTALAESTLSDIIKGKKEPAVSKAVAIAGFLGVDLQWLVSGTAVDPETAPVPRVAEGDHHIYGLNPEQQKTLLELTAIVSKLDDDGCKLLKEFGRRLRESRPPVDTQGE